MSEKHVFLRQKRVPFRPYAFGDQFPLNKTSPTPLWPRYIYITYFAYWRAVASQNENLTSCGREIRGILFVVWVQYLWVILRKKYTHAYPRICPITHHYIDINLPVSSYIANRRVIFLIISLSFNCIFHLSSTNQSSPNASSIETIIRWEWQLQNHK